MLNFTHIWGHHCWADNEHFLAQPEILMTLSTEQNLAPSGLTVSKLQEFKVRGLTDTSHHTDSRHRAAMWSRELQKTIFACMDNGIKRQRYRLLYCRLHSVSINQSISGHRSSEWENLATYDRHAGAILVKFKTSKLRQKEVRRQKKYHQWFQENMWANGQLKPWR
jgi:hypothetical protein